MSLVVSGNNSASLDEANGNNISSSMDTTTTASKFNEDDSASEYTDPENNSAPTELFAEFLATILQKKWKNALKNCKLILEYEPHNKTAKDFYPQLLQKAIEHQSSSSDENCNYTSSLEAVDNEILDNDNYHYHDDDSSSITSSNSTTTNGSMDLNSFSEEDLGEEMQEEQDQEDLINASLSNDSSDSFPESMSSSESIDHRGNCSPTFSFTSLLLDENPDDINNNEPISAAAPSSSSNNVQPPINPSPFTSKLVNMIKRKLN